MARPKGTPNRLTMHVHMKLQELGCDPIEGMARLAMDQTQDAALRGKLFAELAGYLYPKRKAIEHTGLNGDPIELNVNGSARERLTARIDSLAARQGTARGS